MELQESRQLGLTFPSPVQPVVAATHEGHLALLRKLLSKVQRRPQVWVDLLTLSPAIRIADILGYRVIHMIDYRSKDVMIGILDDKSSAKCELKESLLHFSCRCHAFTKQEEITLADLLPQQEDIVGEVEYFITQLPEALPANYWDGGMEADDLKQYQDSIYPLFIDEISELSLHPGALICEPACCSGHLIKEVRQQFPWYTVKGSDANEKVVAAARERNPGIEIRQDDAQTLSYLRDGSVDLFLCSGLLAKQVLSRETAVRVLETLQRKLKPGGRVLVCSKSERWFRGDDYQQAGFEVTKRAKRQADFFFPFYVLRKVR